MHTACSANTSVKAVSCGLLTIRLWHTALQCRLVCVVVWLTAADVCAGKLVSQLFGKVQDMLEGDHSLLFHPH